MLRFFVVLALSLACSWVAAFVFVAVLNATLPSTDSGYGQTLGQTLRDPFVRLVMNEIALISGVVAAPFVAWALRGRSLLRAIPWALGAVLLEIVLVTPAFHYLAWFGSYPALGFGLALA